MESGHNGGCLTYWNSAEDPVVYDLAAGEVIYRSGDDPRLARGGYTYQSRLVPDDRGDTAVLISGKDGTDKMWITVFRMK